MLISYNWLRELTATKLTPLELRERLTMVGLAIDSVDEGDGDSLLDVEVPSNRPDCLSHIGIAREVAVIEKSTVHSPKSKVEDRKSLRSRLWTSEFGLPNGTPGAHAVVAKALALQHRAGLRRTGYSDSCDDRAATTSTATAAVSDQD
jgi:hypothetical protein